MDQLRRRNTLFRVALLAAVSVTFFFAFSQTEHPVVEHLNDKLKHIVAFVVLSFLTDFAFPRSPFAHRKIAALLMLGVFIEVVQYFLPYREASFLDVLADAVGIAGYFLAQPLLQRFPWLQYRWQS